MKKILGGKAWTAAIIGFLLLTLVFMIVQAAPFIAMDFSTDKINVMLKGEYSVDGGEWQPVDPSQSIREHFHKLTIRGKLTEQEAVLECMVISSKDVWFTLRSEDGLFEYSHTYSYPDIPEEYFHPSDKMTGTPGYYVTELVMTELVDFDVEKTMILEVEYPYSLANRSFADCFSVSFCQKNSIYDQLFFKSVPPALLFILVCFFGVFFFPVSGFVLGKINYKYLCFGVLCFFWGLYMVMQVLGDFLNLWIIDYTVCMMTVRLTSYLFVTSIFLYFKSNLQQPVTRAVANIVVTIVFATVIAALALHLSCTADMTATVPNVFIVIAVCAAVMIALLCVETRGNRNALVFLLSWSPLGLTLTLDIADQYFHIAGAQFFNFGLAITMAYQIVHLIFDLRRQYKEAIRYQQMQKELYEAKVGVMVSQIQPHFMYNALTSIAMMCTIDPDTAQEATVTFAKYLRGNMDSLKQTAPVPFAQELEHLKKYLYIEKLRFGDKLKIEYDIQSTDFVLPLLSVQPLVENAVKHGVGMKKKGGTVTIASRETETAYEVVITDDGVGFDTSAPKKDDGRSHVGMENTRRRLQDMCGGEVVITSTVGEGTAATIVLPKDKQPQ